MSTSPRGLQDRPVEPHGLMGAHGHHLFAVFDDPDAAEEAVEALRFEALADEGDVRVFVGEEGSMRLDVTGRSHGLRGRVLRLLQVAMSSDFSYLRSLDEELHDGHVVVAVRARAGQAADEVSWLLRMHAGRSIAYCTHWDFQPVAA